MSSKRRLKRKCLKRKSYPTYDRAMLDCKMMGRKNQMFTRPYRCAVCQQYHVARDTPGALSYVEKQWAKGA